MYAAKPSFHSRNRVELISTSQQIFIDVANEGRSAHSSAQRRPATPDHSTVTLRINWARSRVSHCSAGHDAERNRGVFTVSTYRPAGVWAGIGTSILPNE